MSRLPFMPFYPADFAADTMDLTTEQIGAYFLLILHSWRLSEGSLPNDMEWLKRVLPKMHGHTFNKLVPPLLNRFFFLNENRRWENKRVSKERQKADKLSANQSQNARKRWDAVNKNKGLPDAAAMPLQLQPQLQDNINPNGLIVNAEVVDLSEASKSRKTETLRAFGETWNALAAELGLSAIETIKPGSTRERHALARARELVADFPDLAAGLNALAARIRGSPLLRGEIGNRQWRATFDWVLNASNFTKIMEGNYEVRKTTG